MRRIAKKVLKPKICKRNCTNQQENLSIEIKWKYDILGLKKLTFQCKDLGGKSNKKLSMWIHPWSGSPTQLHLDRQLWNRIFTTLDFPSSRLFSMLWEVSISSNVTLTNSIPPSAPLYNNQPCIPHHRHPYTPAPITIRVTVSPLSLSLAAHYLVIKPSKLYPLYTRPIFNRPIFTLYSARFQSANFDAANQSIFTIFQWANFKWFWNLNHLICNCVKCPTVIILAPIPRDLFTNQSVCQGWGLCTVHIDRAHTAWCKAHGVRSIVQCMDRNTALLRPHWRADLQAFLTMSLINTVHWNI